MDEFHSCLHTDLSREAIAQLYGAQGWNVRKCTWTDYEVSCEWAELVIESDSPVLMHGPVDDVLAHLDRIIAPLNSLGMVYQAECYSEGGELLKTIQSGTNPVPNQDSN